MADLPAPVRVHPLIKLSRWTLLVTGIFYGAYHQKRLAKKEVIIREEEARKKKIRDEKLAIEKKIAGKKELEELERMFLHGEDSKK